MHVQRDMGVLTKIKFRHVSVHVILNWMKWRQKCPERWNVYRWKIQRIWRSHASLLSMLRRFSKAPESTLQRKWLKSSGSHSQFFKSFVLLICRKFTYGCRRTKIVGSGCRSSETSCTKRLMIVCLQTLFWAEWPTPLSMDSPSSSTSFPC